MNEEMLQNIKLQIAQNIKGFMKDAKKSQKDLADYLGVHESTVSFMRPTVYNSSLFVIILCPILNFVMRLCTHFRIGL